jgi:hypothetical protein
MKKTNAEGDDARGGQEIEIVSTVGPDGHEIGGTHTNAERRKHMNPNELTLIAASVGDGAHTACLMSARALLDGRGLTDRHPSGVIRELGIAINDRLWWRDDAERTAVLMPVALDERLCVSYIVVTPEIERKRAYRCADMACRVWTPRALRAQGLVADAERLEALAPVVDEQTAAAAYDATAYAASAAAAASASAAYDATGYVASAAYAATAYAASAAAYDAASAAYDAIGYVASTAYDATAAAAYAASAAADARSEAIALLLELCEMGRVSEEDTPYVVDDLDEVLCDDRDDIPIGSAAKVADDSRNTLWPDPETDTPDDDELEEWCFDSIAQATDGCTVEPDGVCPHGHPSWLIHLGLI